MCSVTTIRLALVVWVDRAVGVDAATQTVLLQTSGAVWAVLLLAAASLGADTDTVSDLDVRDVLADLDGLANDLVADAASWEAVRGKRRVGVNRRLLTVWCWTPARRQHVQVRSADTAVADFNVYVLLLPHLWLEFSPLHLSVDRVLVMTEPTLELVIGSSHYECRNWQMCQVCFGDEIAD